MFIIDFILHIDRHLADFVANYGLWVYGILFLIVFVETGLVVMPLLPGDSLLFAAGALAAIGKMDPFLVGVVLFVAAVTGDTVNFHVGKYLGRGLIDKYRLINQDHLRETEQYFAEHGGKTVIFARYIPIVRTFAPFVSGMSAMPYPRFIAFSIVGTLSWVSLFVGLGYFFGNQEVVRKNFTLVIFAIIGISFAPIFIKMLRKRLARRQAGSL